MLGLAALAAGAQDLPAPAERIQRQAENPLRWIIEAGKLKSRPKAAEAPAPSRVATVKPAARPAPARPPERAAAVAQAASAATPAAVADAAEAPGTPADPVAADPPAAPPPVTLELLDGVEPTLPDEIDNALDTDAVLELALLVMPDGTVGKVSTIASSHPAVDAHAIAAVRQWRFKPVPQMVVHHVELVFHPRR